MGLSLLIFSSPNQDHYGYFFLVSLVSLASREAFGMR